MTDMEKDGSVGLKESSLQIGKGENNGTKILKSSEERMEIDDDC